MATRQSEFCLNAESMARLAQGEVAGEELGQLEDHIGSCERCRHLLESASLDSQWSDEVLPVLRTSSEGIEIFGDPKEGGHDEHALECLLKLLGPTDDPHKLGRIGTYEVIGVIGRGGMGVVFKAFDAALNRFVAIKMLLPHLAVSGAARKRFAREGQAAAAVIDDNVLPIYSVAEWQGVPYLVTQYSRGTTLQKRIQDQGPLELKEILRVGMQTARGLAAAHAQGLVHRDVKPSNILLDGSVERALLTDFGLARAVDDASITRTGIIAGTPQYMSPEQARGGNVDARSDLFGLGCVLYTMCTGRPPFRADNSYAVLRLITDAEPRPIQEINPEVPEWLCRVIARLMAKSPNDRYSTAVEVAELLESCLAHVQQPTVTPLPEQLRISHSVKKPGSTYRWMTAVGVMLMGFFALSGFVISLQSQDGTLLIESSVDDVTVRVSQGDTVVRKLTVTKAGTKIDVAAGSYTVAIEGNVDGIAIENGEVNLRRGGTEIVKLSYQMPPALSVNLQLPRIERATWQSLYVRALTNPISAKRYQLTETQQQQVLKLQAELKQRPTPFNRHEVMIETQAAIQKVLTLDQDQQVRRNIFVAWNVNKFQDANILDQLQATDAQRSQIDAIWQAMLRKTENSRVGEFDTADERQRVFDEILRLLTPEQQQKWEQELLETPFDSRLPPQPVEMIPAPFDGNAAVPLSIPEGQNVKLMEQAIFVTDVQAAGQVLYFTLNQRKFPEGALGLLEIQFRCDKPMPLVWTGPAPDAATVLSPKHTVEWLGIANLPMVPLPIGPEGHKVAFIFPDDDSAVVAAKQLAAIGDQSLLDAQRRANAIDGRLRDDGIIFGEHTTIGKFTTHFRVLVRNNVPPEQPGHGMQRPQFIGVNWRPLYLAVVTHPTVATRYSLTETQQQEIKKQFDEFVRTSTFETHDDLLKLTQATVQEVLTPAQDENVRREIWLRWNVTKFRDAKILFQLNITDEQQQQINAIWQASQERIGPFQDPPAIAGLSTAFTPERLTVEGPTESQRVFDEIYAILTIRQRSKFLSEIQDPIVDGVLTDPRQRVLAIPKGAVREIAAPPQAQMALAFPTINWRQLYIGRAMEPRLAEWHQVTPEQLQCMQEISQTFLRDATPANRETEEKRAQSAIQDLLTAGQDQLLRKEIWLAVNANRLRASAAQDQLGLDPHQRRQIDEVWRKFEAEVRQNNGWLADGTDSHQSLFDDTLAVLTVPQRQLFFSKLQDPVFDAGYLPGTDHRDRKAEGLPARDDDPTATKSRDSESHKDARINRPPVDADDTVIYATEVPDVRIVQVAVEEVCVLLTLAEKVQGEKDWSVSIDFVSEQWVDVGVRSAPGDTRTFVRPVTAAAKTRLTQTSIPLPLGENGKVIALIFPTEQSAEAAAKMLQSPVMDDLRQTGEIAYPGSDEDNHLLEGQDEQLGQYHVRLRLDFTWSRPDPFPRLEAPGVIGRDRAYVELVNSLPPNVDPWLTAEQTEKFREMKSQVQSEGTTLTQQAYANWKETIRELLTEPQQRRLEQLIWQRYGCLAFLQPDLQTKLKLNPSQIKAIQDAWQGHTSRTQPFDQLKSEEIPETQTRTAKEIDSAEQVWLTIYAVLDSSQRIEFDSLRGERYRVSQPQAANGESKVDTTKRPLLEVGDQSANQGGTSSRLVDVAVLPSEGIFDLNVLANSTEEAKGRAANRRLRDPNAALLAELQGTWLMTAIVAADGTIESVSDPVGTGHSIHFKDSTIALYRGNDQEPLPRKFTLDASTPTPEIDIEGHDGVFTLGLIETQNGTLHIQLGEAGGKRPSDSIKPAVHYQYRRIPASLVALGEQKTEGALSPEDVQQQEAVIREANRQLKDPNRVLLAQLQGSWTATAMILPNGQLGNMSKPAETGMMIRFDDMSGYLSQGQGDDESKFTYTIDASTSPAEIDLRYANGTHALGLLEIKNGTLELQLGAGGDARPSPEVKASIHQLYRRTSFYWQWIPSRE